MKKKMFKFIAWFFHTIVPILLIIFFFIGVFFNLWKVQELSFTLSLLISVCLGAAGIFGFGKLIKIF